MLIHADTNYAIASQVEAPLELRQAVAGDYRSSAGGVRYRVTVPGLQPVNYRASLGGSFDRPSGSPSAAQQLRQQASAGIDSVQIATSSGAGRYMTIPLALITGFFTAVAAFTMVLRRPYWG